MRWYRTVFHEGRECNVYWLGRTIRQSWLAYCLLRLAELVDGVKWNKDLVKQKDVPEYLKDLKAQKADKP